MADNQPIRLNKFLAERLGVSRREADELIVSGKVLVDGNTASLGTRIDKNTKVCYNKKIVPFGVTYSYIAFNKPVGYVCSRKRQGEADTIYAILPPEFSHLKTVGRLDKDSSGLILLTNDGDFAFEMTHPKFNKTKIYEVALDRPLAPLHQQAIADFGVVLEDGVSKFEVVRDEKFSDRKHFLVTLHEGRNRQIRRTFMAVGYMVVGLHRVTFGKYTLSGLKPGEWEKILK